MTTRTVPLKHGPEGRLSLAHPLAAPGPIERGGRAMGGVIAVTDVPSDVSAGAVLRRMGGIIVMPLDCHAVPWPLVAGRGEGAIVHVPAA